MKDTNLVRISPGVGLMQLRHESKVQFELLFVISFLSIIVCSRIDVTDQTCFLVGSLGLRDLMFSSLQGHDTIILEFYLNFFF